jgi:hypothetical protein
MPMASSWHNVYGRADGAIALSDTRLTNDEARRISKLISRLPELVELERDRNKARSRRKPAPETLSGPCQEPVHQVLMIVVPSCGSVLRTIVHRHSAGRPVPCL